MTLRDHAQGCWRMRGLGQVFSFLFFHNAKDGKKASLLIRCICLTPSQQGQTIDVLLVHEIKRSVDSLSDLSNNLGTETDETSNPRTGEDDQQVLVSLLGWLQSNGVDSEEMQLKQFSLKEMENCWRHKAFKQLMESRSPGRVIGRAEEEPFLTTRFSRGCVSDDARALDALDDGTLVSVVSKCPEQDTSDVDPNMSLQESRWRVIQAILKVPRNTGVPRHLYGYTFASRTLFGFELDCKFLKTNEARDEFLREWEYLKLPDGDEIFKIDASAGGQRTLEAPASKSVNEIASRTSKTSVSERLNEAIETFYDNLDHRLPNALIVNANVLQNICERRDHFVEIGLCDAEDMTFQTQQRCFRRLVGGEPGEDALDSEQEQEQEQVCVNTDSAPCTDGTEMHRMAQA